MAPMRVLLFRIEPRWGLCLIFLFAVVAVPLQDENGSCYVPQEDEVPIRECDPIVYNVGETLHLPCHNLTSLHLTQDANNVEWSKDGRPLNNYREFNFTKNNLQISDSGDYLCHVGSQHSFSHKVLVGRLEPPRQPPKPRCTSRYIGTYTCSWSNSYMYNTNLSTRFQLQFCELRGPECEYFSASSEGDPVTVIVNSTRARFFVSLCVANCRGQAISGLSMVAPLLTSVPPPPRHVHMIPISVDQMNVSFDPPFQWEDEHVAYRYQFIQERTSFAVWEKAMISDTVTNNFVLEVADRKPFSEVCIKVAAFSQPNPVKISEYTTPVCSYTQMTAPSVGPPHFTSCSEPDGLHPDLRKVNFTWEHLKPDEANGIIIKYTLILSITSPATNASKEVHIIPPNDLFFLAEGTGLGVQSQYEYRAELYAENAAGKSPPSVNTVLVASEVDVLPFKLLLIVALLLSFGFLVAGFRLFFSIRKRVLPEVPEPSLNSQLFRMKMESPTGIVEKEVFDKLHCSVKSNTSTGLHTNEDSSGYFQDQAITQGLLEKEAESAYVKVDSVRTSTAAKVEGGYVTWK